MAIVERHQSPDGQLTLLVDLTDGDWTIGFGGFPFHTHGDILAGTEYAGTPEQATRSLVADILECRRPIVIWRVNGEIRDLSVPQTLNRAELDADIARYGFPGRDLGSAVLGRSRGDGMIAHGNGSVRSL